MRRQQQIFIGIVYRITIQLLRYHGAMASRRAFVPANYFRASQYLQTRSFTTSPLRSLKNQNSKNHSSRRVTPKRGGIHPDELEKLFAEPTWSVESLLPPKTRAPDAPQITSQQLHHLLRLSALPPPETSEEEQKMLDTLAAQLHFVSKIQQVDTTDVEPLQAIRDETMAAREEQKITMDTLKDAFKKEEVIGHKYERIRRDPTPVDAKDVENWDVLGSAERKAGKYFVVESERPQE
jgi:aspartyl/glutamyl-tRNA(Asn/Gln) amidotransferase C subunit